MRGSSSGTELILLNQLLHVSLASEDISAALKLSTNSEKAYDVQLYKFIRQQSYQEYGIIDVNI